jgi:hypothetical protein
MDAESFLPVSLMAHLQNKLFIVESFYGYDLILKSGCFYLRNRITKIAIFIWSSFSSSVKLQTLLKTWDRIKRIITFLDSQKTSRSFLISNEAGSLCLKISPDVALSFYTSWTMYLFRQQEEIRFFHAVESGYFLSEKIFFCCTMIAEKGITVFARNLHNGQYYGIDEDFMEISSYVHSTTWAKCGCKLFLGVEIVKDAGNKLWKEITCLAKDGCVISPTKINHSTQIQLTDRNTEFDGILEIYSDTRNFLHAIHENGKHFSIQIETFERIVVAEEKVRFVWLGEKSIF